MILKSFLHSPNPHTISCSLLVVSSFPSFPPSFTGKLPFNFQDFYRSSITFHCCIIQSDLCFHIHFLPFWNLSVEELCFIQIRLDVLGDKWNLILLYRTLLVFISIESINKCINGSAHYCFLLIMHRMLELG